MGNVTLKLPGSDLASRRTAAVKRYQLVSQVQQGNQVTLDLSEVQSISESYADELFGVLVAQQGFEWVQQHVSIIDVAEHVLDVIATAIQQRLDEAIHETVKSA